MNQYVEAIEPLLQAGRDVLVLAFSSGLSATFQSSKLAVEELSEKYPERKLYTVDTLCASLGQGLLVWYAAQERKKGRTIEEVRDIIGADSLGYLGIDRLSEMADGLPICKGCFNGIYPMEPPKEDIRGDYER